MEEQLSQAVESITLNQTNDEIHVLHDISNQVSCLKMQYEKEMMAIQEKIEKLSHKATQETQQAENQATSNSTYSEAIENLENRFQQLQQASHSANLKNQKESAKLDQLVQQKQSISQDRNAIVSEVIEKTRCKQFFDLFTNMSGIEWNYNCSDNQVKGVVMSENDCQSFHFNRSDITDFEITNKLWQLL